MYPWAVYSIHRLGNSYFSAFITSKVLRWPPWLGWPLWNICVINDHGYVTLVVNTFWSFLHSWPITGFVTRLIRRVPLVEQELLTLPQHRRSPRFLVGFVYSIFTFMCMLFRSLFVLLQFLAHLKKGHVSYCHHLASVVVVRRNFFQNSSPLKVLDQWKPNLVWIIIRVSSFTIVCGDAVHQPTWPLLLKIEHIVKLQVLGNNSKTVNNIKNLTLDRNDQHIKIYLPCNFEVNLITHLGVNALFSSNL